MALRFKGIVKSQNPPRRFTPLEMKSSSGGQAKRQRKDEILNLKLEIPNNIKYQI